MVSSELPEKPATCSFITPQTWGLMDALQRMVPAFDGVASLPLFTLLLKFTSKNVFAQKKIFMRENAEFLAIGNRSDGRCALIFHTNVLR